jgi:hypothetical protein
MTAHGQLASHKRIRITTRICGAASAAVAALICLSGCMVPSYHLPGGFSSSYQRQLYGLEPVPPDPYSQGLTSIETHAGIFYPTTTASYETPFKSQPVTQVKLVEPMRLPPEPPPKSPPLPAIQMAQ